MLLCFSQRGLEAAASGDSGACARQVRTPFYEHLSHVYDSGDVARLHFESKQREKLDRSFPHVIILRSARP
jgi:hypothetical protein